MSGAAPPPRARPASALARLRRALGARRPIPCVQQLGATDCGPACLAMVLSYLGRDTSLREVRDLIGATRGVSARSLIEGGRVFGLRGRGVQVELHDLALLPRGAVLHWGFDHFVVLDRVEKDLGLRVVDPALGARRVPPNQVRELFTGVALLLEPGERFEPRRARRAPLLAYLGRLAVHRPILARTIVLSLVVQVLALGLPLLLGVLVDSVVPRRDHDLLLLLAAGLGALVVFHGLTLLLRSVLLDTLKAMLDAQLSLGFVDHLAQLPYGFFVQRASGDLLARFESNRDLRQTLTGFTLGAVLDGGFVLGYLTLLLVGSPPLGLLALGLGVLQVLLFAAFRGRTRDLAALELEVRGRAQAQLVEILAGIETLKSLGAEKHAVERWSHAFVEELNVSLARARLGSLAGALTSALTLAAPLCILLAGAWQVLQGQISLGSMLALNALAAGFLGPLSSLIVVALHLQEARGHIERIDDVLGAAPEQPAGARPVPRLRGGITLCDVGFRYGPRDPWALQEVSLEVRPGEHVAIVGRSGAGKSTLARLLVGLYRPTSGRILFDGVDAAELDLDRLRAQVGVVTQDARLFALSVKDNLGLAAPEASREQLEQAARRAQVLDELLALPMGLETPLADGAATLSGGQRQRLALARALARDPAILLLDEATSDLDTLAEARVSAELDALGCTRISIAHRLSTVMRADRIVVLDGGRVIENGTHAELLAAGGAYAQLVAAQITPTGQVRGGDGAPLTIVAPSS